MSLDITIYGRNVSIVNIYSPNLKDEQFVFIEELHRALYDKKILIFGGILIIILKRIQRKVWKKSGMI